MVKVMIQTDEGMRELEGEFFFGVVVTEQGDGYTVTECMRGKMRVSEFPHIAAKAAANMVKSVCGTKAVDQMTALMELSDGIKEAVGEELSQNKESLIAGFAQLLDGFGKGF